MGPRLFPTELRSAIGMLAVQFRGRGGLGGRICGVSMQVAAFKHSECMPAVIVSNYKGVSGALFNLS